MSIDTVLSRIAQLDGLTTPAVASASATGGAQAPDATATLSSPNASPVATAATAAAAATSPSLTFAQALNAAATTSAAPAAGNSIGGVTPYSPGAYTVGNGAALQATGDATAAAPTGPVPPIVAVAEGELGQAEMPPGSNDSPRIAQYRTAVPGAGNTAGPWCAYFASWAGATAGTPVGVDGQGSASVEGIWSWAQQTGRAIPAGPGVTPQAGDLVVWGGEHVGIVEAVLPNGDVQTIEGNSGNQVSRRVHGSGANGATGYVRLG